MSGEYAGPSIYQILRDSVMDAYRDLGPDHDYFLGLAMGLAIMTNPNRPDVGGVISDIAQTTTQKPRRKLKRKR